MVHDWVFLKIFYLIIFDCSGSSLSCGLSSSFCEQGLLSSCDVQASHFGGFSCCRAWSTQASAVAVLRLQNTESIIVGHTFSCSAACGVFPDQGLNPCLLHWQVDSLLEPPGKPLCHILDSTYKQYYMAFVLLFLTYFTQYLQVHPYCCKWHSFLFMAEQYSIVYICVISSLTTHLSIDIWVVSGFFNMMSNIAMNI